MRPPSAGLETKPYRHGRLHLAAFFFYGRCLVAGRATTFAYQAGRLSITGPVPSF